VKHVAAGERHGRLVVVKVTHRRHKIKHGGENRSWAHCRCDCGQTCGAWLNSLRSGNTSSCGCIHRENSARRLAERNSAGNKVRGRYKPRKQGEDAAVAGQGVGVAASRVPEIKPATGHFKPLSEPHSFADIMAMIERNRKIA